MRAHQADSLADTALRLKELGESCASEAPPSSSSLENISLSASALFAWPDATTHFLPDCSNPIRVFRKALDGSDPSVI